MAKSNKTSRSWLEIRQSLRPNLRRLAVLFLTLIILEYIAIRRIQMEEVNLPDGTKGGASFVDVFLQTTSQKDKTYCQNNGSLHNIALKMAKSTSTAFPKVQYALSLSDEFMIELMPSGKNNEEHGIFSDVRKNLIRMMEGFGKSLLEHKGLSEQYKEGKRIISIENSFYSCLESIHPCNDSRLCISIARIIIQTEYSFFLNLEYSFKQNIHFF